MAPLACSSLRAMRASEPVILRRSERVETVMSLDLTTSLLSCGTEGPARVSLRKKTSAVF